MKLNIELLKAIREKIATTPAAYDQRVYARSDNEAPCGTRACIAGWACVLSGKMTPLELVAAENEDSEKIYDAAQEALGLDPNDADVLFDGFPSDIGAWPEPFGVQWRDTCTKEDRAAVAVAYLDHIIKTGQVSE